MSDRPGGWTAPREVWIVLNTYENVAGEDRVQAVGVFASKEAAEKSLDDKDRSWYDVTGPWTIWTEELQP